MNAYHPFRLGLVLTTALCLAAAIPATAQATTAKSTPTKSPATQSSPSKATPAKATDVDGYKGMRWGAALADLQRTKSLVLTKENQADGSSLYALLNEELRFGKASLSGIHCSFAQDRLQGVILLFSGASNSAAIKTEATAKFGESVTIEQKGEEMYSWVGKSTSILLSYNRRAQTGFLFLKPKNPLKPIKGAKPAQATQAAKPQKPAEIRPTPPVEDIETALDRASMPDASQVAAPGPPVSTSPSSSPSSPASTPEPISPEIQRLIDRDRVLTRQCWGGGDSAANEACRQMRLSVKQLTSLGMCMSPGNSSSAEPEVIWSRCGQQQAAASTPASAPAPAQENPKDAICSLVAELFAAAAEARQEGATPMVAEEELLHYQDDQRAPVTIETIRETVELVYFDSAYAAMEGNQLAEKAGNACRSGRGPYARPLPQR